jgi:site-specific DNA recombinase
VRRRAEGVLGGAHEGGVVRADPAGFLAGGSGIRALAREALTRAEPAPRKKPKRRSPLKFADNLEGFLSQLRDKADTASVEERQRVLRLLVNDVLIGPEKITIRHRIPIREHAASQQPADTDTEGDIQASCPLR